MRTATTLLIGFFLAAPACKKGDSENAARSKTEQPAIEETATANVKPTEVEGSESDESTGDVHNPVTAAGSDEASPLALALAEPGAIVIDVRTPEEFAEGHAHGAINLPVDEVETKIAEMVPDPSTQVVLYCRSGARADSALEMMKAKGYTRVLNARTASAVDEARGE